MAQVTLDAPFTLDPKQASKFKLVGFYADCEARTLQIRVAMVDASGNTIEIRTIVASGAPVQTWLGNQESAILTRLLAQLNVTGTIA